MEKARRLRPARERGSSQSEPAARRSTRAGADNAPEPRNQAGMILKARITFELLRDASKVWLERRMSRFGASLAYYTAFSIAPLLIIALGIAGCWFGDEIARKELFGQLSELLGRDGGAAVQSLVTAAANRRTSGAFAAAAATGALLAGSTGVFVELQDSLNAVWEVSRPAGRGVRDFFKARLLSFAMVLGTGFLLLVSLVLSSVLAALGKLPIGAMARLPAVWEAANFAVSLGVITLLFAMIYKVLPDVQIAWGDVWTGAFVTALLFNLGKFLIGYYLGKSGAASLYGAAGSFMIVLMWVYYSAQILFYGAAFTRLQAERHGSRRFRARPAVSNGLARETRGGERASQARQAGARPPPPRGATL